MSENLLTAIDAADRKSEIGSSTVDGVKTLSHGVSRWDGYNNIILYIGIISVSLSDDQISQRQSDSISKMAEVIKDVRSFIKSFDSDQVIFKKTK